MAAWIDAADRLRWLLLVPVVSVATIVEAIGALAVLSFLRIVVDPELVKTSLTRFASTRRP